LSLDYLRGNPACGHNGSINVGAEDESDRE
jgi:hypothetical protein